MAKVEASIQIDRPVEDVYAYATTVDTLPQWLGRVLEVEQLTDGPLGVGTRIRAVGKMLGRRMSTLVEVTALEPGARFAFTGVTGPFTAHNNYTFESVAGSTKVTDSAELELSGPVRRAAPARSSSKLPSRKAPSARAAASRPDGVTRPMRPPPRAGSTAGGRHRPCNPRSRVGAATTAQLVWILAPRLPGPEGGAQTKRYLVHEPTQNQDE